MKLTKTEIILVSGGEGGCSLYGGTFNSTYSDKWPVGYGPCSPECEAEGIYHCIERPLDLSLPQQKQGISLVFVALLSSGVGVIFTTFGALYFYHSNQKHLKKTR